MSSQIYTSFSFLLFITFSIIHLFTLMGNSSSYKGLTKGFLMPLLMLFYCVSTNHVSPFIILALLFSFFGDVGLFIADTHLSYYQKGSILSFALAHVFYSFYILPTQAHIALILFSIPSLAKQLKNNMLRKTNALQVLYIYFCLSVLTHLLVPGITRYHFALMILFVIWCGNTSKIIHLWVLPNRRGELS